MEFRKKIELQDILRSYGSFVTEYFGEGILSLENGQSYQCDFGIGQLQHGPTYLVADIMGYPVNTQEPDKKFNFKGISEEGFIISLSANGFYISIKFPFKFVFVIESFTVKTGITNPIRKIAFGLTNFVVDGNSDTQANFNFTLPSFEPISIQKKPDYENIIRRLKKEKNIEITSELIFSVSDEINFQTFINTASTICFLLSICRGTKIFWTYYGCYDDVENLILEIHVPTVNHSYASYPELIPSSRRDESIKFLQNSYSTISENLILKRDLIIFSNIFTDARTGTGYLQSQGIKVVVLMELLLKYVLEDSRFDIREWVSCESEEGRLIEEIKQFVKEKTNSNDDLRQKFSGRISGISRTTFKDLILRLCSTINLVVIDSDVSLFVKSRNKLIHTGTFHNKTLTPEKRGTMGINNDHEELRFLINFCDKIFLRLYGYSGSYNNIRKPWASNLINEITIPAAIPIPTDDSELVAQPGSNSGVITLTGITKIPIIRFLFVSVVLIFVVFILLIVMNCLGSIGKSDIEILYDVMVGWLAGVAGGVSLILLYPGQQNKS